jgi:LuxR family maltose regulon positive regulatory protein
VDSILQETAPVEAVSATLMDPLSEQEVRVLKLLVAGKSNQEIADELVISVGTAKWHVHNVLQKLGVNNRAQAIVRARELGIE